MGIHRRKLRKIAGDTEKYYTQIAQDEEVYEKTRLNDERRQKDIETFITRFRAKARLANMVQSRIKTIEKMEKREKLEKIEDLDFSFRAKPFPAKHMLTVEGLTFGYGTAAPIIDSFDLTVNHRDRICVVGQNGKGKTTLLKLLTGTLRARSGRLQFNPNVVAGFFEQTNVASLVDSRTVEEEIIFADPEMNRQKARNICGAMMFSGDDALKKVSVLSGGEKSRVMLAKLLVTPCNLLLLDEPTNHLDMDSCDALLAAVDNFDGAVIMVTHNELFLHALAARLVVFQKDRIEAFDGSYRQFLDGGGWLDETDNLRPSATAAPTVADAAGKLNKKEIRRRRSEILSERTRCLNPVEKRIARIEDAIDTAEKRLERLNADMQRATMAGTGAKIAAVSQSLHACQADIDGLFAELESVGDEYDRLKTDFDRRLEEFGSEAKLPAGSAPQG
jgi:ATP-binding cassette subfamily F protein 3